MAVDYTLYLVTDSTPAVLGDKKLQDVVRAAVEGGVTIVQYRDKHSETSDMIYMARSLRAICQNRGVPLIINDRVDVALAADAQGVHLGQTDMDPVVARRLLGPEAIIGVTVSSLIEAISAVGAGVDYLGIGTVYATPTSASSVSTYHVPDPKSSKEDTKSLIGTTGVREILGSITSLAKQVSTVAIGGINANNIQHVLFKSQATAKKLDGVAVVSAIIAADDAKAAAQELRELAAKPSSFISGQLSQLEEVEDLLGRVNAVIKEVGLRKPLCHNMTNLVVQNLAANVALAV
ncbi:MAG: hypothetical protein Q9179_007728 [Wetmoreana sp. 5 TL-2023]